MALLGTRPEGDHIKANRAIAEGSVLAERILHETPTFPVDGGEFLDLLKKLHAATFGAAVPAIAGRFRYAREVATFGGEASHKLTGTTPAFIERDLLDAHKLLVARGIATPSLEDTSTILAIFLEEFFRIHPFCDGNGRMGRLMIRFASEASGLYYMKRFNTVGKSRRRYLRTLEYAHKHAPKSTHVDKKLSVRNPFIGLARWIAEHLVRRTETEEIEIEPTQPGEPSEYAQEIEALKHLGEERQRRE